MSEEMNKLITNFLCGALFKNHSACNTERISKKSLIETHTLFTCFCGS